MNKKGKEEMELYQIKTTLPAAGFCESGIGGRTENQDSYGFQDTPFGLLLTVCDGMGGGPAGKLASSIAVNEIIAGLMEAEHDHSPSDVVLQAIRRANKSIIAKTQEKPHLKGMGTTCTVLLLNENSAIVAHVGDSRVYQLRGQKKVFRTFDHSVVFEMVRNKVITEEQARLSEQSNLITRALGLNEALEIDITERPFLKDDRFVLCTDGIHGTMPEPELVKLMTKELPIEKIVDGMAKHVDELGIQNGGGHDNLTLALVETKTNSKLKEKMDKKSKIIIGVLALGLMVSLAFNMIQNKTISTLRGEKQPVPTIDTMQTVSDSITQQNITI